MEESFFLSAPGSPLDNLIKISVFKAIDGKGLCTSSGTFGHSINMGRAYAVTVLAKNACLADALATAVSNRVRSHLDLENVLKWCTETGCVEGVVILVDDRLAAWGGYGWIWRNDMGFCRILLSLKEDQGNHQLILKFERSFKILFVCAII